MTPEEYNAKQLAADIVTLKDLTAIVKASQRQLGLLIDGYIGPDTLKAVRAKTPPPTPGVIVPPPAGYVDRRAFHTPIFKGKVYKPSPRAPEQTTGICLHQTACVMGERLERYNTIGSHFVVTRDGKVLHMADVDSVTIHGNGWNARTIGIEFDGQYEGVDGQLSTLWDDPTTKIREMPTPLTQAAIDGGRQLIRWLVSTCPHVKYLVAHRQSSSTRRNDPGSLIWKTVALPMMKELGLTHGDSLDFKIGDGYPIPAEWDPRCSARY